METHAEDAGSARGETKDEEERRRREGRRVPVPAGVLRRTPLLHKILLANALVVGLGAVVGTAVSVNAGRAWTGVSTPLLAAGFAGVGLALSLAVNALLVRWLLDPLERLERAAERIQAGGEPTEEAADVPVPADPSLGRLVRVFNGMLRSLAQYRARLRRVAALCLESREEERVRLSALLQDDTAQRVASCLLRLRFARRLDGAERDHALDGLRKDLSDTLESVRGLSRSLRPPELDDIGLENALRALARQVRERGGPDVRIDVSGLAPPLSAESRLTLYRAVQAALHGCERRSDAEVVRLALERRNGDVSVELRGDGEGRLGLPGTPEDDEAALELFAMRERARLSGGDLSVDRDAEGRARSLRIRLPVTSEDPAADGGELRPVAGAIVPDPPEEMKEMSR